MEKALIPYILAALVFVPLAEIVVFIEVGGRIGAMPTIALVVAIALLGTWLLRRQGLATFRKAQTTLERGEVPVAEAFDGLLIAAASLLMVTPGLLTDAAGLALLVPALRRRVARFAISRLTAQARAGFGGRGGGRGPVIEGEAERVEPDDSR